MINAYGPTEATVWVMDSASYQVNNPNIIGRPMHNVTVYVLDQDLSPMPIGVPGELYIGGVGVARGYLNQDELTRECFIANPFASQEDRAQGRNLRLYKSGDLVKWLPDGNLVYLGRTDFQVKLRGYRIEIGEIESVLSGYGGIAQCVVLMQEAKEQDQKHLVAYYVLDSESGTDEITPEVLRIYLQTRLPEYMVPSFFVQLEELPLKVNGKVDRRSLPEPDVRGQIAQGYVEPRTEIEKRLVEIWKQVLGVNKVGIYDNFFELGGNSLLTISLHSQITQQLKDNVSVTDLFQYPNIDSLAAYIHKQQDLPDSSNEKAAQQTLTERKRKRKQALRKNRETV